MAAGILFVGGGIVTGMGLKCIGLKYASGGGRVEKALTELAIVDAIEGGISEDAVVVMFLSR